MDFHIALFYGRSRNAGPCVHSASQWRANAQIRTLAMVAVDPISVLLLLFCDFLTEILLERQLRR